MNLTAGILQAVADRFLVNIQADVIHTLHGGASLVVSESARSLSSAFVHQALLLTHTFKQYGRNAVFAFPICYTCGDDTRVQGQNRSDHRGGKRFRQSAGQRADNSEM